jgi:tRNA modification GTPase
VPRPLDDTIFACATAPGRAGIAIIRISGPRARAALELFAVAPPPARRLAIVAFLDPKTGEALDRGMVAWFQAPRTYTGEDLVEFHIHGSSAVLSAITEILGQAPGFRLAEPGEFTRRAFENGKLDLTEAEAVADLVAAETAAQRRQALRQLGGELGALYESWRKRLLQALARQEALIDFPDEDLPDTVKSTIWAEITVLTVEISGHLADNHRGERLREGLSIAILGPPNAGKSSLLNALARREMAITSPIPGTTRDVIEAQLDLGGYPVTLSDTAGLRDSADTIEAEGVRRARGRAGDADLKLMMVDVSRPQDVDSSIRELIDRDTIVVANKIDLTVGSTSWADELAEAPAMRLSLYTGEGLDGLIATLTAEIAKRFDTSGAPLITRARHRAALEECLAALRRSAVADLPELAAEDLRLATRALGRITGRVDVEDILDVIFREFCIGK